MTPCEATAAVSRPPETSVDFLLPFEEVYRLHAPDVYRFCLAMTRSTDAAEDATADVFTAACAAYSRAHPSAEDVRFWLLRIARNMVVSRWRAGVRRARIDRLIAAQPSAIHDVHDVAAARDDLRAVVAALARLRRRDRVLIGLRAAQLSYAEVADFLGMSEGAARVATHRALRALHIKLEES